LINRFKILIFAAANPLKVERFIYLICRYKRKKIALLSLLLSSKIPTFTLLFKNVEPYFCSTFSQKVTGQPAIEIKSGIKISFSFYYTLPMYMLYIPQREI